MSSRQKLLCANLAALLLLGGCYTPSPPDVAEFRSIAINIENKTFEGGIEVQIKKKIRDEFIFDGRLSVARGENGADLRLCGQITSYVEGKRVGEPYVTIGGIFTVRDLRNNRVLWENKIIKGSSVAPTNREAKRGALTNLARSVVKETLGG
ncbi:hypothetical protein B9J77_00755 [candidate division NPL-UPA2 bacterium Unc8]|uniref:Uncharacterized protein n=2 Tax=Bacteria TaxID=2 RepID=A0A9E2BGB5_PSYF1|nr:hypothetical protein [Candidatus Psychracetigena formicireducens]MBT9145043.1 hypothetical protein [Candidatus Psychracetigena formicireducens]RII01098.1 MAG: hypothetical protein B9J77_00755 [candidate division NPL-UPA2 bacterium Unc8]